MERSVIRDDRSSGMSLFPHSASLHADSTATAAPHDAKREMRYGNVMPKLEYIEEAIATLAPDELAKFRAWFEAFDAARFDEKIARDAAGGRLDALAEQALADFRKGRARERA